MGSRSFCRVWTRRWWSKQRITADRARDWQQALVSCHSGSWTRIIVGQWLNQPFSQQKDLDQMLEWLTDQCHNPWFCSPRGRSDFTVGAQLWLTEDQDQFQIWLMAAPVVQIKCYSHSQFADHVETMLGWMK